MRRRELLILGSTAIAFPLAARAQQKAMPVIGYLSLGSPGPATPWVAAFR
jgi:putative ABC transport system substrate-binding protein